MVHKATPITQKSKSSPLRMSEGLVSGAKQASDTFTDFGKVIKAAGEDKVEEKTPEVATENKKPEPAPVDFGAVRKGLDTTEIKMPDFGATLRNLL